jgi:hypothetical protein
MPQGPSDPAGAEGISKQRGSKRKEDTNEDPDVEERARKRNKVEYEESIRRMDESQSIFSKQIDQMGALLKDLKSPREANELSFQRLTDDYQRRVSAAGEDEVLPPAPAAQLGVPMADNLNHLGAYCENVFDRLSHVIRDTVTSAIE